MVTTPYNFKQWFRRHYPDIRIYPVYGMEAYTFDKPLDASDMYAYNVQQLPNGHYIVFVGRTPEQIVELMREIKENGLNYVRPRKAIPTTFTSFENWMQNNNIRPLYRTHISKQTATEALHIESDEPTWNTRRDWYMYEFEGVIAEANKMVQFGGPHTITSNNTYVLLVKASTNTYVSKKQLFLQKFSLMQPIFEQCVAACAKEEWEQAKVLVEQYMGIQFDITGTVDIEALKEAYGNGELSLFVRCRSNITTGDIL